MHMQGARTATRYSTATRTTQTATQIVTQTAQRTRPCVQPRRQQPPASLAGRPYMHANNDAHTTTHTTTNIATGTQSRCTCERILVVAIILTRHYRCSVSPIASEAAAGALAEISITAPTSPAVDRRIRRRLRANRENGRGEEEEDREEARQTERGQTWRDASSGSKHAILLGEESQKISAIASVWEMARKPGRKGI